jgi:hypothetical protein
MSTKKESKIVNFALKKTIHISMSTASHAGLKIACFQHNLSMQEVLEEFANLISVGHPDILCVLESIAKKKLQMQIRKLDGTDTETIYSILEMGNPLKDSI